MRCKDYKFSHVRYFSTILGTLGKSSRNADFLPIRLPTSIISDDEVNI